MSNKMNIFDALPIGASWIRVLRQSHCGIGGKPQYNGEINILTIEKRSKGNFVVDHDYYESFFFIQIEEEIFTKTLRNKLVATYGGNHSMFFYNYDGGKLLELYNPFFDQASEEAQSGKE